MEKTTWSAFSNEADRFQLAGRRGHCGIDTENQEAHL